MRILGLDCGIASIGWSLIEFDDPDGKLTDGRVLALGTWMFDPPEEKSSNGTKLKSAMRRLFRGQRRVIRRRAQRTSKIRQIFATHGLIPDAGRDALQFAEQSPWQLRVDALTRLLSGHELALALGHIAIHRGFKSNAKGTANAVDDGKKMLKAASDTRERLTKYTTPAEMLMTDPLFIVGGTHRKDGSVDSVRRLRNRGDFSRSLMRDDLAAEVRTLFNAQRRLGNHLADAALQRDFGDTAFFQRPLQDSEKMLRNCPFEKNDKRTARCGYSYEVFRLLSRLVNLTIVDGKHSQQLTSEELAIAMGDFGSTAKYSYKALHAKLGLPATASFEGVKYDEMALDLVARKGEAVAGTYRLRKLVTERLGAMTWGQLVATPEKLDRIAEVVSFREDLERIRLGLSEIGLEPNCVDMLVEASASGELAIFAGTGQISAKAARAIIPGLLDGNTYDKAADLAGYVHTDSRERTAFDVGVHGKSALAKILSEKRISPDLVGSPTARKALIEAVKQVKAIIEIHGIPDRIHVELARDVGKSIEERDEITRGIEKRNREKDRMRRAFEEEVGRPLSAGDAGAEELLRFELWKEQNCCCVYSRTYISPSQIVDSQNSVQVDHILPLSRFGDDSFHNKALCLASENQVKKGRTPYEWFLEERGEDEWRKYVAHVESLPALRGKKRRNYLLKNAEEVEQRFRTRNLNDTRWTCRLLLEALKSLYPDATAAPRVLARPGALTDKLRRAWGLQDWKKAGGKRIPDDRHHALDAAIVAATSESMLQRLTRQIQANELVGRNSDLKHVTYPWPKFRGDVTAALEGVFVARAERRRARGKAHDATVRQVRIRDGVEKTYERKDALKMTEADLIRLKDLDRNQALYDSLKAWIDSGSPKDIRPRSPKGDEIRKVRLETKSKVAIRIATGADGEREGSVDRSSMVRLDVFESRDPRSKSRYRFVPIYAHQIVESVAPNQIFQLRKLMSTWPVISNFDRFIFSLVPMSLLEVTKKGDRPVIWYYRGFDSNDGRMSFSPHQTSLDKFQERISPTTIETLKKLTVDRLGNVNEVLQEARTWRGERCM